MSKRLVWLPVLVLAAAALACSSTTSAGSGGTSTPKALYKENFSNDNSGWGVGTDDTSSIAYDNGEYAFTINDTKWLIWGNAPDSKTFGDIHLEVTAKNTGTAKDPAYGIVCNYQDDKNFYYLGFGGDGYYAIAKYENDNLTLLTNPDANEWLQTDVVPADNASYKISADCAQGTLSLYANGQQVASVQDSTFTKGQVGLFVRSFDQTPVEVRFDDFVVTAKK